MRGLDFLRTVYHAVNERYHEGKGTVGKRSEILFIYGVIHEAGFCVVAEINTKRSSNYSATEWATPVYGGIGRF